MSKHPSIYELVRKDGSTSHLVKYRDASGRQRSRTFRARREAVKFQAEQRVERDRGKLTRKPTRQTLDEYWEGDECLNNIDSPCSGGRISLRSHHLNSPPVRNQG